MKAILQFWQWKKLRVLLPILLFAWSFAVLVGYPVSVHLQKPGTGLHEEWKRVDALLRQQPDNPDYLTDMGWILYQMGRLREANNHAKKAIAAANDHIGANYLYGLVQMDLKQYSEAENAFQFVVQKTGESGEGAVLAHYGLGLVAKEKKEYSLAVQHFEKAKQLAPQFGVLEMELGMAYQELGEKQKALVAFQHAVQLSPVLETLINIE
ncbi:tetratricopeptide repeat protein [Effusibacillus lacus]|uniref:Uncharacterized protein n=1 Tax=Effusibacillus lacus TaxID=1348429 RepID=A0A292YSG1_9BACL|nr:tetratricopeptide repeat protein [Effusibacillus lacus]TCS76127.1 tetratricopeptide repeat protein [Effusibacillus lacus]GAX91364.1 hypothetical protein EFBL_3033 [Effusibacillus lacus]